MPDFIIENGVLKKYIGKDVNVIIPYGVESIGENTFVDCHFIETITIPSTVKKICLSFYKCINLKEVHITDMSAWCNIEFSSCNPLYYAHKLYLNGKLVENLVIPDDVVTIKKNVFCNCDCIKSVTIPQSVKVIEDCAFEECYSIRQVNITSLDQWLNIEFKNRKAVPFNSETHLFINGEPVSDIIIPNGVTSIGNYVFSSFSSLLSITIPDSVTSIGKGAFLYCRSLDEIHIPDSVTRIGSGAFEGCTSLKKITISNSVDRIESYSFGLCESLSDIAIPFSVTSIENGAFMECVSLKDVTIPNSVMKIESHAFENCSSLKQISLSDAITEINESTFKNCTELERVHLPDSVCAIDESAFEYCRSLKEINIPSCLRVISKQAFRACTSLNGVYIKDIAHWCTINFYDNPLYYAHNLYLNGKICTNLVIPNSVTRISGYCFNYCQCLESICIPPSVKEIGAYAFVNCTSLKEVHIADKEQWFAIKFDNYYSNPIVLGAKLYFNSSLVTDAELNAKAAEKVQEYLDSWKIDVIFEIDMYNYSYSYTARTFYFEEKDVVIKNGVIAGFDFYDTFISLMDAGKKRKAPDVISEMIGEPSCRFYSYSVVMKLTEK